MENISDYLFKEIRHDLLFDIRIKLYALPSYTHQNYLFKLLYLELYDTVYFNTLWRTI